MKASWRRTTPSAPAKVIVNQSVSCGKVVGREGCHIVTIIHILYYRRGYNLARERSNANHYFVLLSYKPPIPTFSPRAIGHTNCELAKVYRTTPIRVHLQEEVQNLFRVVEELRLAGLALGKLLDDVLNVGQSDVAVVSRVKTYTNRGGWVRYGRVSLVLGHISPSSSLITSYYKSPIETMFQVVRVGVVATTE